MNYAVNNEKLSPEKVKKRFHDKVIIGEISTKPDSIIYSGSREQLQAETEKLLSEADTL